MFRNGPKRQQTAGRPRGGWILPLSGLGVLAFCLAIVPLWLRSVVEEDAARGVKPHTDQEAGLVMPWGEVRPCPDCDAFRRWDKAFRARRGDRSSAPVRAAFSRAQDACRKALFCGDNPVPSLLSAAHETCPPEARPLDREAEQAHALTRSIKDVADRCLAGACPEVSCDGQAQLADALRAAEQTLAAMATLPPPPDFNGGLSKKASIYREARQLVRAALVLPEDLARLASTAPSSDRKAALASMGQGAARLAQKAEALNGRIGESMHGLTPPDTPSIDGLWRLRLMALLLTRVADTASGLARTDDPEADFMSMPEENAPSWAGLGESVGQMALEALHVKAFLRVHATSQRRGPRYAERLQACTARHQNEARAIARDLAIASLSLRQCGNRGGCPAGRSAGREEPEDSGWLPLGTSGLSAHADAQARLDAALALALDTARSLEIGPSAPIDLQTELPVYLPGEAVRLSVGAAGNACMVEDGAWLGLVEEPFDADPRDRVSRPLENAEAVVARTIQRFALDGREAFEVLTEAPLIPGRYDFKAFAPSARGGWEMGSHVIEVTEAPSACRGFTGTWSTDFGILRLVVRDGVARGTYKKLPGSRPGFLLGTVANGVLTGTWQSELGRGGTRLALTADGLGFDGTWSHIEGKLSGTGRWQGTCVLNRVEP